MTARLPFFNNCVNWDLDDVDKEEGLNDMVDSGRKITRDTFLRHVQASDLRLLELKLGYSTTGKSGALTMKRDWHVNYYRGKLHGEVCYYFVSSAVEFVFHLPKQIQAARKKLLCSVSSAWSR